MEKEKQLLISATTSKRRNLALAQLPEIDLKSHPGPENELDSPDTMLVAKNKIDYLVNLLQATLQQQETAPLASQALQEVINAIIAYAGVYDVIAADVLTATGKPISATSDEFVSQGKPKNQERLQETFYHLHKSSSKMYKVFAGSQILQYQKNESSPIETKHYQEIKVVLRADRLRELASDKGLENYLQRFQQFYSSKAYSSNGLSTLNFTDIAAGLSLPVLIKGDYVQNVELNHRHVDLSKKIMLDQETKKLLKQIIFGVAVGYSPHVLKQIYPGAYDFIIDNWHWLESVVNHVKE